MDSSNFKDAFQDLEVLNNNRAEDLTVTVEVQTPDVLHNLLPLLGGDGMGSMTPQPQQQQQQQRQQTQQYRTGVDSHADGFAGLSDSSATFGDSTHQQATSFSFPTALQLPQSAPGAGGLTQVEGVPDAALAFAPASSREQSPINTPPSSSATSATQATAPAMEAAPSLTSQRTGKGTAKRRRARARGTKRGQTAKDAAAPSPSPSLSVHGSHAAVSGSSEPQPKRPKEEAPVSDAEAKKQRRREKNRLAAQRCRQRRQERIRVLEDATAEQKKVNETLRDRIAELKAHVACLEASLANHNCKLDSDKNTASSSSRATA